MGRRERQVLLIVLTVGALLRLGWALAQPRTPVALNALPDQREYLALGGELLRSGSLHFYDPRFQQEVYAYRLPGYPLWIAACDATPVLVRVTQSLLDISTAVAAFLVARQLSGKPWVAVVTAALVCLNPYLVYFAGLILSETLFTAAITWGTFALLRQRWLWGVFCFGIATSARPTALLIAPLMAFVAAWSNSTPGSAYRWWRAVQFAGLTGLLLVIGLVPWAWRNHHVVGRWVWTTTNTGITLYDGFHAGATGASDQLFVVANPQLRSMNEVQRSRWLQDQARQWAIGHLRELPRLTARKLVRGWSPVPLSREFGRPMFRWIGGGFAVPFDLLCLVGLCARRMSGKVLLLLPAVLLTLAQAMSVGSIRYRVPAEPLLAVLAAGGAMQVWTLCRALSGKRVVDGLAAVTPR